MELVTSGHPEYDEARAVFNRAIDKRPAVIARCATEVDVAEALAHAQHSGFEVAVRSGGHSVAGQSVNDGGLVVDVRGLNRIEVDPHARTMRVGSGATWGEIDEATQAHGLAVTGGRATSTGVAGFTLGGGDGWLARAFGLACDNLLAVELVTADGRMIRASESENPELFWALHGGGGNFGVATAFEFRLHPLGPEIYAGIAAWPMTDLDRAREVARTYRDLLADAPDTFGSGLMALTDVAGDFGEELVGVPLLLFVVCHAGDPREGLDVAAPVMGLGPQADFVGVIPYTELQVMTTDPPGRRHYWSADYHESFGDDALEVFLDSILDRPSPLTQQVLFPWGGAVARVPDEATPLSHRSTRWVTHPFGVWEDPAHDDENIAWVRAFRRDIADHASGGVYLNFIGREGEDRVRAAFGDATYRRLQAVKAEFDPQNVFRGNHNIVPA